MRILFVQYTSEWTGPSSSLVLLARGLRAKHELLAVLPGRGELAQRLADEGVDVRIFPAITKWQLVRLARLVRREAVDIVYANDENSTSRIAALAAHFGGGRYVCHVRSMGWNKSWLRLGYLRSADAVIAVSHACADSIRRFVRPGHLYVVHNGVSVEQLQPALECDRDHLRRMLDLPKEVVIVMGVAHLCERKGQLHSIEALGRLSLRRPDVHLCLVGSLSRDKSYVGKLRSMARLLGVEDRVHLMGFRPDVARLIRGAEVFVHTALVDPHPRAVVEAMAAARPVVAFDIDGVSETVVDGETGLLVQHKDDDLLAGALLELLDDPERAAGMGRAGRRRVESVFMDSAVTAKVRRILERLTDRGGHPTQEAPEQVER